MAVPRGRKVVDLILAARSVTELSKTVTVSVREQDGAQMALGWASFGVVRLGYRYICFDSEGSVPGTWPTQSTGFLSFAVCRTQLGSGYACSRCSDLIETHAWLVDCLGR